MPQLNPNKSIEYPYADESYAVIGASMEVHKQLGRGFLEAVYKDALQHELKQRKIRFEREKKFEIVYKGVLLPHYYIADFVIDNKIILEIKAQDGATESHYRQVINYLAVTNLKLGLLINFGEDSLVYKRLVLNKNINKLA
ncbi:MAG: GxxExxY protein [Bacteroidota bacterium]